MQGELLRRQWVMRACKALNTEVAAYQISQMNTLRSMTYTALRPLHPDVRNHPRADDLAVPLALVYRITRVYHYRPLHSWYLQF